MKTVTLRFDLSDPGELEAFRLARSAQDMMDALLAHYRFVEEQNRAFPTRPGSTVDEDAVKIAADLQADLTRRRSFWVIKDDPRLPYPKRAVELTIPVEELEAIGAVKSVRDCITSHWGKLHSGAKRIEWASCGRGIRATLEAQGIDDWFLSRLHVVA